ncbi:HET-domain-containing protein [Annulohypoxylon maeteangense]|uniref:HET-domain-containing protein n=1 Tax=Annulohypoxylon maeteangense TaxID=1927788 RepID=UPI0020084D48|nr:HET-domain-containing protein [Annulohypoxylon maeteangense]KAI0884957.1 HET-domain-containing protein [Annulohypoxylon maeteangense]
MSITIPPLANLCETCRVLEFDDFIWPGAHQAGSKAEGHYLEVPVDWQKPLTRLVKLDFFVVDSLPDLDRLDHTAKKGCGFCSVLRRSIQKYAKAGFDEVLISLFYQWYPFNDLDPNRPIGLKSLIAQLLWIGTDENGGHLNLSTWLHFGVDSPPSSCARWLRLDSSPKDEALCPENLGMVLRNLQNRKQSLNTDLEYPTRLIYIGTDKRPTSCRLIDTTVDTTFKKSSRTPYVAFSYCWGPLDDAAKQFKTEKYSLDDRIGGFELDEVSPVLRDAILTTRALVIQYLWMDAVCIIQNDLEDWEKESSRMSIVYETAAVTVCTPASTSCQQGFLNRDWTMTSIRYQSKMNKAISGSYILRLVGEVPNPSDATFNCFFYSILRSDWAQRGWVLQEYQLAQTVVIFGRTKLHGITENGQQSETCESVRRLGPSLDKSFYQQNWDYWERYTNWMNLITEYSKRKLTNHSDKLPAISGLASRLFDSSSKTYLAGLVNLHVDLFWINVRFRAPQIEAESNVIGASTSMSGLNPYGAVNGGTLVMESIVIPLVLHVEPLGLSHERSQENKPGGYVADISLDWDIFESTEPFDELSLVLIGSREVKEDFIWVDARIHHWTEGGVEKYENTSLWIAGGGFPAIGVGT